MSDKLCILTHNFPKESDDAGGKFIKDMLDLVDADYRVIGSRGFTRQGFALLKYCMKTWVQLLKNRKEIIIAFWTYPAGLLAFLAGRKYVVVAVGLDVYGICRSPILKVLFYPVFAKADKIVFIGMEPMLLFAEAYGSRFSYKTALAYFPVEDEYMKIAKGAYAKASDRIK